MFYESNDCKSTSNLVKFKMAQNGETLDAAETAQMFQQAEIVLKSMQTPQAIRDLPTFDGNPVKLHNFIRSVDNLFPFISALENTPFFNVWLQSIRAKIIGEADQILEIYGTPLIWNDIKANLIAYYNDKRDCVTLTRELFQVQQITTIEKFYGQVQNLLSLLINNTNILIQDNDLKTDRIATHKENALQVFLAGLKEPIGGNVRARKPSTLKEAFDACVEERNFQAKQGLKSSPFYPSLPKQTNQPTFSYSQPPNPRMPIQQTRNFNDNIPKLPVPNRNVFAPKPFPIYQPKPAPMEVDRSIRTKQVNYMNRPNLNNFKPSYPQQNRQNFFQQTGPPKFHVEELHNTEDPSEYETYYQNNDGYWDDNLPYEHYYNNENPYEQFYRCHNDEKPIKKIEQPTNNTSEQTSDQKPNLVDNLNFRTVPNQDSIT